MIVTNLARFGIATVLAFATSSAAVASTVEIDSSGPDSSVTVTIDESTAVQSTTTTDLQITNNNQQTAASGNLDTATNTNSDPASGSATNNNTTTTTLSIDNGGSNGGGGGDNGGGGGSGGGGGGGSGSGGGGGSGGDVLGASTGGTGGGVATLPEVGAKFFVDVSALRALYHPASLQTPITKVAHSPEGISLTFLLAIALISLFGAYGSAAFGEWRSRRRGV